MKNNKLLNPEITFYIRTAKKLGFITKSKKSTLTFKQIKQLAQAKSKIPTDSQILYYNGQQVQQQSQIKLADNSIVHVLDQRNVGKSKMKLLVKRLPQNSHIHSFQIASDMPISDFIKNQLSAFYQEPAEKLFFVYTGRELNTQKSFSQEHIEDNSQVICVHETKDRKKKLSNFSENVSVKSQKTEDTLQNKEKDEKLIDFVGEKKQLTCDVQQKGKDQIQSKQFQSNQFANEMEWTNENKIEKPQLEQQMASKNDKQQLVLQEQLQVKSSSQHQITENDTKLLNSVQQSFEVNEMKEALHIYQASEQKNIKPKGKQSTKNKQKKLIKSIEEIKCNEYESDQDSDNQINFQGYQCSLPKKLPEEDFLIQHIRKRSPTKQSNNNNSQSSSISEPNFKKKKKVSEVQTSSNERNAEGKQQKKTQILHQQANKEEKQQDSPQSIDQAYGLDTNLLKTRDEIFDMNTQTFASVLDEPQHPQKLEENHEKTNNKQEIFNSYANNQEEEVYDSQMNSQYYRIDGSRPQVKYNKGFMNFSNASFLQTSKLQPNISNSQKQREKIQIQQCVSEPKSPSNGSQNYRSHEDMMQHLNNRNSQYYHEDYIETAESPMEGQRNRYEVSEIAEKEGDSLSFSKYPSENVQNEDEDNLFAQYRRGVDNCKHKNVLTRDEEVSQSNLLSDTYHNPNVTDIMNSLTFNLQPNPADQHHLTSRQSLIQIIAENQNSQEPIVEEIQKRQSQIQTNFKDSADPSQITSNHSQMNFAQFGATQAQQFNFCQPPSIIDNLNEIVDYTVNVNQVHSQNSEDQHQRFQQQFQKQSNSIISKPKQTEHQKVHSQNPMIAEENSSSNVFVSYQSYRLESQVYGNSQSLKQRSSFKNNESNLLLDDSQSSNREQVKQNNIWIDAESYTKKIQTYQNSAIRIVQEDQQGSSNVQSPKQSRQLLSNQKQDMNEENESVQCSGAFHQISQSLNEKGEMRESNLLNNLESYQITFRKDNSNDNRPEDIRSSNLLNQLEYQAHSCLQEAQLLPGDYIYSTDTVQSPEQILEKIIQGFRHCL